MNGKKMFIFQAAEAFKIWHDIQPEINEEVNKLLESLKHLENKENESKTQ